MKTYKIWIVIEEYDDETDEYQDVAQEPYFEYDSLPEAWEDVHRLQDYE